MRGPLDYRNFTRVLRDAGATIERETGGHEQWRLPNGRRFTIPRSKGAWSSQYPLYRWRDLRRAYPEIAAHWEGR